MFGDVKSKRLLDITKYVQKALDAGWDSVSLRGDAMGNSIDPAPFVSKTVTITYTLGGKRAEKSFADGAILRFATDLQ